MNERIKKLMACFEGRGIDALLVTDDINIRYLTDFPASESWLLVSPKKVFYITDFRYLLEAQKGLRGVVVERCAKSLSETIAKLAGSLRIKRLGFDDRHMSVSSFKRLAKSCRGRVKLLSAPGLIEDLRQIKTPLEIALVRKAVKLTLEAYDFLGQTIEAGMTEKDVLERLERFVKGRRAAFAFHPIIASGPNSCFPHAKTTERKIRNNEPVLIDLGIDWEGYKSDLTRVLFLGKIPRLIQEVYRHVQEAQQRAIKKIKAKATAREIDQEARNYLTKKGLGKFFGHSLGHGVGLEVHEAPAVSSNSSAILKEGMVFTVEPAVYIPDKFGIRIEDMVLVDSDGCEVLR